jgi:signal transduction histidine kinase
MALAGQCGVALERARLYEAEREARAAAESANRAKGEFLAAMSHELRTPLSAIAGHVDLLALDIYGPTNPQQQDALRRVKRAEEHLLGIVDELLSFARLERGRVEFHLSSVKLSDLLDDLAPLVGPQLAAKNLEFSVPPSGDSLEVEVDRGKLIQVLLNLVSNAIKFTTPGGRISIDVAETPDSSAGQQPTAQISVTDTGIGIPADKLQAIFDPFVQLGTDPANRQGTGLGLAISRDLARGMGGELTARSTPGVSTTFVLTLVKAEGS